MPDPDYQVYIVKLPTSVRGAVTIDPDGYPSIYINACLSRSQQYAALSHELRHLRRNDMFSSRTIREVERPRRR